MLFVRSIRTDTWALVRSWIAKLSYVNTESTRVLFFTRGEAIQVWTVWQRLCPEVPAGVPQPDAPWRGEALQMWCLQPAVCNLEQPEDPCQVGTSEILQVLILGFILTETFTPVWVRVTNERDFCFFSRGTSLTMPNRIIVWVFLLIKEEICTG